MRSSRPERGKSRTLSLRHLRKRARAGQPVARDAEVVADGGAEIAERRARAERAAAADVWSGDHQRHVLARVIGRDVGWIAAVIGADEEEIVRPQIAEQPAELEI